MLVSEALRYKSKASFITVAKVDSSNMSPLAEKKIDCCEM